MKSFSGWEPVESPQDPGSELIHELREVETHYFSIVISDCFQDQQLAT